MPYLRGLAEASPGNARWKMALLHGAIGVTGLVELFMGSGMERTDRAFGLAGFGTGAEWLIGFALLVGVAMALIGLRRRPPGLAVALHECSAIAGVLLVLAIVEFG